MMLMSILIVGLVSMSQTLGSNIDDLFTMSRLISSSKTRYVYNFKNDSLLNTTFRFADRLKRDRTQVRLNCSVCSESNYFINRTPRYEITTGVYLSRTFKCRSRCASKPVVSFVPSMQAYHPRHSTTQS